MQNAVFQNLPWMFQKSFLHGPFYLLLREQGSLPWKAVIKPTFESSSSRDVDLQSYRTGAVLDVFLYFFSIQRSRTNTELYLQLFSIQVFSSICITRKKQHLLSQVSASNKACRARGYCKSKLLPLLTPGILNEI